MELPIFQVDAFTGRPFAGNPAAVCLLERWLPDEALQQIAAEMNLSETAFLVEAGATFEIRWFTPAVEVPLCGHATLASGAVVLGRLRPGADRVELSSRFSGALAVSRAGEMFELDFPAFGVEQIPVRDDVASALGARPVACFRGREKELFALFDEARTVRELAPGFSELRRLDPPTAVGITAPGGGLDGDVDFVSRYFAPFEGIDEDPVTGSAHCTLAPYWAKRLGRRGLRARQVSRRGGELTLALRGPRVGIAGRAVVVLEGKLRLGSEGPAAP
jgi:PhzF family phenazine biosynthesis protein